MLVVNPLTGFGASLKPVSFSFITSQVSAANAASYTFSSVSLGAGTSNRSMLLLAANVGATVAEASLAATVDGNAATSLVSVTGSGGGGVFRTSLFSIVGADETVDIVITPSANAVSCGIALWNVYDILSATPVNTYTATNSSPLSVSASSPADSAIFAYAAAFAGSTPT
jgi:hypothetical protein